MTGYFGIWELSWRSLSIPASKWLEVITLLNARMQSASGREGTYKITITPRSDYNFGDRTFEVNYTGGALEYTGNTGGTAAAGNKGLFLSFRTVATQAIYNVTAVEAFYGGTHSITGFLEGG